MKNIIYLGGGWATNIGNAFIDLGSLYSLKAVCPDAAVHVASSMPRWFFSSAGKDIKNAFVMARWVPADYVVVSGMALCEEFFKAYGSTIKKLQQEGTRFIINGGGGARYTKEEIKNVRAFLKDCPPYAFISRDRETFKNYHDAAEYSYDGIDCGFFVSDCFSPAELSLPRYVIFNFDTPPWKVLLTALRARTIPRGLRVKMPETGDALIVRTHHSCWGGLSGSKGKHPYTFISDTPEGYLTLYANTQATYTDRIHAAVATLAFGKPAQLFSLTPRMFVLHRVGALSITNELTYPNGARLQEEKQKHLAFLKNVFAT